MQDTHTEANILGGGKTSKQSQKWQLSVQIFEARSGSKPFPPLHSDLDLSLHPTVDQSKFSQDILTYS